MDFTRALFLNIDYLKLKTFCTKCFLDTIVFNSMIVLERHELVISKFNFVL